MWITWTQAIQIRNRSTLPLSRSVRRWCLTNRPGDYSDAPIAAPPNGLAALIWAIAAVALTPYLCLSFPLAAIAVMAAVWTLYQPRHAKRAYRRCAIAALVIVGVAVVALIAGIARLL